MESYNPEVTVLRSAADLAAARAARAAERIRIFMLADELRRQGTAPVGDRLAAQHYQLSTSVSPVALARRLEWPGAW